MDGRVELRKRLTRLYSCTSSRQINTKSNQKQNSCFVLFFVPIQSERRRGRPGNCCCRSSTVLSLRWKRSIWTFLRVPRIRRTCGCYMELQHCRFPAQRKKGGKVKQDTDDDVEGGWGIKKNKKKRSAFARNSRPERNAVRLLMPIIHFLFDSPTLSCWGSCCSWRPPSSFPHPQSAAPLVFCFLPPPASTCFFFFVFWKHFDFWFFFLFGFSSAFLFLIKRSYSSSAIGSIRTRRSIVSYLPSTSTISGSRPSATSDGPQSRFVII